MEYNPFFPEVRENPYPYYAYLRQHAPVYQVPGTGFWAVSRYDDVFSIFRSPQVFSSSVSHSATMGDLNPFPPEAQAIISYDLPEHTRLRKLVNRAFTPRRVASLETRIRAITHQLLEPVATSQEFDLIPTLAAPLPVYVIAELLGVPLERYADFKRWTDSAVRATSGANISAEERGQLRQNLNELFSYFRVVIAECRREPKDHLLSDLVRAEEDNQMLTPAEVLSLAVFLILAGSETTMNLIANAMIALGAHPDQFAQVRANPALVTNVIEETLRYNGPIQTLARQTTQEVECAGTKIPAGVLVLTLVGSANHDEQRFVDPERFNITRNTEDHIGFGFGIHFCLGAQLARLEAQIALEVLLDRFPRLSQKDGRVEWVESIIVRGPKALPLVAG